MPLISDSHSKQVEGVIAWGSVAYALGFLTVMVHTARVGVPIVQLLDPIYMLVGAPLAIVAFFSRQLWLLVKSRTSAFRQNLVKARTKLSEIYTKQHDITDDEKAVAYLSSALREALDILTPNIPFLPAILYYVIRLFTLPKPLPSIPINKMFYSVGRWLAFVVTVYGGLIEINRYIGFMIVTSIIPIGVYLYVMFLYPEIPQTIGGGKPVVAKLILDAKKMPPNMLEIKSLFDEGLDSEITSDSKTTELDFLFMANDDVYLKAKSQAAESITTADLDLLFMTNDAIYVKAKSGLTLTLRKEVVNGIIWGLSEQSPKSNR